MFTLTACGSSNTNNNSGTDNTISDSPKESVQLSAGNFSKYVAVNSNAALISNLNECVIFYSYFIGADYCKFVNCTVTYAYLFKGTGEGTEHTIHLSLSGDGQAEPFCTRITSNYSYYALSVIGASGMVEVYR